MEMISRRDQDVETHDGETDGRAAFDRILDVQIAVLALQNLSTGV